MKFFIRFSLVCLLVSAGLLSAGCRHKKATSPADGEAGEANRLVIWNIIDDRATLYNLALRFNELTGAQVLLEQKQPETMELEFLDALANNQGPDVVLLKSEWLPRLKDKLIPAPAEVFSPTGVRNLFVPAVSNLNIIDDQVYGLTLGLDPLQLYANIGALNQARERYVEQVGFDRADQNYLANPATVWSELRDQNRSITLKKGSFVNLAGIALGTTTNIPGAADIFLQLAITFGGSLIREDHQAAVFHTVEAGRRPGLQALDFFTSFADPRHPNYSWNTGIGSAYDRFAEGRLTYLLGYQEDGAELRRREVEPQALLPPRQEKLDRSRVLVRFNSFGVTRVSRNPQLAWQFLAFLITPDPFTEYIRTTGYASALNPAPDTPKTELSGVDYVSVFKGTQPEAFDETLRTMLDQALVNRSGLASILDSTGQAVTVLLQTAPEPLQTETLP